MSRKGFISRTTRRGESSSSIWRCSSPHRSQPTSAICRLRFDATGVDYYPAFQISSPVAQVIVAQVLDLFARDPKRTDWQNALWFVSANGWLRGAAPVDLLDRDPDRVLAAARHAVNTPIPTDSTRRVPLAAAIHPVCSDTRAHRVHPVQGGATAVRRFADRHRYRLDDDGSQWHQRSVSHPRAYLRRALPEVAPRHGRARSVAASVPTLARNHHLLAPGPPIGTSSLV